MIFPLKIRSKWILATTAAPSRILPEIAVRHNDSVGVVFAQTFARHGRRTKVTVPTKILFRH